MYPENKWLSRELFNRNSDIEYDLFLKALYPVTRRVLPVATAVFGNGQSNISANNLYCGHRLCFSQVYPVLRGR